MSFNGEVAVAEFAHAPSTIRLGDLEVVRLGMVSPVPAVSLSRRSRFGRSGPGIKSLAVSGSAFHRRPAVGGVMVQRLIRRID